MKILFKSPEKTSTIIIALTERRDGAIKECNRIEEQIRNKELSPDNKDIMRLRRMYEETIKECNDVLDDIGYKY